MQFVPFLNFTIIMRFSTASQRSGSRILLLGLGLSSCVSLQQKREQDEKIFAMQTHMIQLEDSMATGRSTDRKVGENRNKTLTAAASDLERMGNEIKRMRGDLDAVKIGVETGQMPGQELPPEGSVATRLADIVARLSTLETRVQEQSTSANSTQNLTPPSAKKEGAQAIDHADLGTLKIAYDRKRYKEVAEDAPKLLRNAKGRERQSELMMYGESLLKLNRPKEAALQFNDLVELKPEDKLMAVAKLRLGDSFKAMGEHETSQLYYQEVIEKHPGTSEAKLAKKALKSLNSLKSSQSIKTTKEKK